MSIIKLSEITKTYQVDPPIEVLKGIDLEVATGEKLAILGKSGAGKSTLLNILGLLDVPSGGSYELAGQHTEKMPPKKHDSLRSELIGFVFQDYHVLGHRTVAENLDLRLAIGKVPYDLRTKLIDGVLADVGLTARKNSLSRLLSGGEKQRLAVARAIVTKPRMLLADEPTGNLDTGNARAVFDLFTEQAEQGVAVIVISHDERISNWADRILHLVDGRLQ